MSKETEPSSRLTLERDDIWQRALLLSTKLTEYQYVPKVPDAENVLSACGGGGNWYRPSTPYVPPPPPTPDEIRDSRIEEIEDEIAGYEGEIRSYHDRIRDYKARIGNDERSIKDLQHEIDKLRRERDLLTDPLNIVAPEGAMEWLLHEVGHWVAASDEERRLPDYGFGIIRDGKCECKANFTECRCGDNREWEAWAFEEIILSPFGKAREFCPPPHRGGVAFTKSEIPPAAFLYIEQRMRESKISVEQWQGLWGEWIAWGQKLGTKAPWLWESCR